MFSSRVRHPSSPEDEGEEDREDEPVSYGEFRRPVAEVLLAEAEPSAAVALRHANVVHHEVVDAQVRGAHALDRVGRCRGEGGQSEEEGRERK